MPYDPTRHHRRSIRLADYDYAQLGLYFVTTCVKGREPLFGRIVDGVMQCNAYGAIVGVCWQAIGEHFAGVALDAFVVMPDHVHCVVCIEQTTASRPTLGQVVGYWKYQAAKQINTLRATPGVCLWQRNYYERIIRSEQELAQTRQYIAHNPQQCGRV